MTVVSLVESEPNQAVIDLLADLLERAKAGEIIAIAGVTMNPGREFAEFFSDSATIEHPVQFIAYLRVLQMRFERQIPLE